MKCIPVQEAVGSILCHDITQILPGEFKGRRFKKGHIIHYTRIDLTGGVFDILERECHQQISSNVAIEYFRN